MRTRTGTSGLSRDRKLSRSTELTRRALIDAAVAVFAEHGFEGASVRVITAKAKANQAAITYHFGGKEGLYREVLRHAMQAFEEHGGLRASNVGELDPKQALEALFHHLLVPLRKRDRLSRFVRLFQWETLQPTRVLHDLIKDEPPPVFSFASELVRHVLPPTAAAEDIALATFWLIQQPFSFVRAADQLSRPPFAVKVAGEAEAERVVHFLVRMNSRAFGLQ